MQEYLQAEEKERKERKQRGARNDDDYDTDGSEAGEDDFDEYESDWVGNILQYFKAYYNKFLHTRDFSYFVFYSTVRKFFTNEKSATHHATHCICSILPFIDLLFISRLSQGMKNKTVAFEE